MTKRRGYTLTELLTTIAVIAILATVTIVGFVMYIDRSHNGKADTEFAQMNKAFEGSYITGGLFYIGTDGSYDIYLEKHDGIAYITVLPTNGTSYNPKELESITLTDYADDFKGLSGTLTCTLAKGFYDDYTVGDKHYYRTLCDLKYTTEEGIERNFIPNDKPKEQLKVILEAKMIEKYIRDNFSGKSLYLGEYSGGGISHKTYSISLSIRKDSKTNQKYYAVQFNDTAATVVNMVLTKKCSDLEERFDEALIVVYSSYEKINTINPYGVVSRIEYGDAYKQTIELPEIK